MLLEARDGARDESRAQIFGSNFWVPDVARTARWYLEHLGFRTARAFPKQEPYAYASLRRDAAEIMLLSLEGEGT